jgi:hypothetical protein
VKDLKPITGSAAVGIKLAAGIHPSLVVPEAAAAMTAKMVTKPGKERWPVKTGTDADVADVGKAEKPGGTLDYGFIDTTVEELVSIPRPSEADSPSVQDRRMEPTEATVWRLEAEVIALKQEADGDYHLVLQGQSGHTMIGEVPTPQPPFVSAGSPFLADIKVARQAVYDKLVSPLPATFTTMVQTLAPATALLMAEPDTVAPKATKSPAAAKQETFQTKITPTKATLIGVGFFDRLHGQMGVAPNGIELHPVLNILFPGGPPTPGGGGSKPGGKGGKGRKRKRGRR